MHAGLAKRQLDQASFHCEFFACEQFTSVVDMAITAGSTIAFDPDHSRDATFRRCRRIFRGSEPTECTNNQRSRDCGQRQSEWRSTPGISGFSRA